MAVERDTLAATLQFMHKAAANMLQMPIVEISKAEAETLSEAALNVFAQYDLEVSPKIAAWAQLATVCGTVYGMRYVAYAQWKKEAMKQARSTPQSSNVATFPDGTLQ